REDPVSPSPLPLLRWLSTTGSWLWSRRRYRLAQKESIIIGDAQDLPFEPCSFDTIINIESSHLYQNPQLFFMLACATKGWQLVLVRSALRWRGEARIGSSSSRWSTSCFHRGDH
ncbi:hypothetical protein PMAYCL1PPCAC_32137, partial [Pristionchus mayeri]